MMKTTTRTTVELTTEFSKNLFTVLHKQQRKMEEKCLIQPPSLSAHFYLTLPQKQTFTSTATPRMFKRNVVYGGKITYFLLTTTPPPPKN